MRRRRASKANNECICNLYRVQCSLSGHISGFCSCIAFAIRIVQSNLPAAPSPSASTIQWQLAWFRCGAVFRSRRETRLNYICNQFGWRAVNGDEQCGENSNAFIEVDKWWWRWDDTFHAHTHISKHSTSARMNQPVEGKKLSFSNVLTILRYLLLAFVNVRCFAVRIDTTANNNHNNDNTNNYNWHKKIDKKTNLTKKRTLFDNELLSVGHRSHIIPSI